MIKRMLCLLCVLTLLLPSALPYASAQGQLQWEFDGDLGGWAVNKSGNGVSIACEDDSLMYTVEKQGTTNTFLLSPDNLAIDGAANKKITLKIKNALAGVGSVKVAFITDADQAWDATWTGTLTKTVSGPSLSVKDEYVDCVIDMSSNAIWNTSTIKRIRILISEFAGTATGTMYVDAISIGEAAEEVQEVAGEAETVFNNVSENAYHKAAAILKGALLMEKAEFATDHVLTRGEFAYVISRSLFSGTPSAQTDSTAFYDVPGVYKYADSIRLVSTAGVMSGSGDGNFMPHKELSFDECVAALVKLTGYDLWAQQQGGYPLGYYSVATKNEILEDVVKSETVNYAQVIVMLKNALDAQAIKYEQEGSSFNQNKSEDSILNSLAEMYEDKGIVVANSITSLTESSGTGNGELRIDVGDDVVSVKDIYNLGGDSLGMEVEFAYRINESDEAELVYIGATDKNNIITAAYDEIDDATTNRKFVYEANGRKRTEEIDTSVTTIYNNKYFASETEDTYKPSYGSVTLLDNDDNGKFDVVFVNNAVVKEIASVEDRTLYYNSGSEKCDYTNYDAVEVTRNGKQATLADLKSGDIALIYESADEDSIVIEAVDKKLTGVLKSIDTEEAEAKIDEEVYKLTPYFNEVINVGSKYKFKLDAYGNIAGLDLDYSASNSYAFVLGLNMEDNTPLPIGIKLLTSSGKTVDYECSEKLRIDDIVYKTDSDKNKIITHLKKSASTLNLSMGPYSQPITIKTDGDGKVKEIDTIMVNVDGSLQKDKGTEGETSLVQSTTPGSLYYYKNGVFMGKFVIDATTTIFSLPQDYREYDSYYVAKKGDLKERYYTVAAFNTTDYLYSDLVLMMEAGADSYEENMAVVKKVLDTYDDEYGEGKAVQVIAGGKELTLELYNAAIPENLDKGDVIRYSMKRNGQCMEILRLLDYSEQSGTYTKALESSSTASYAAKYRFSYGKAVNKKNQIFTLTYGLNNDEEVFLGDSCTVALFDTETGIAQKGTINDMLSEEHNGIGSDVVVYTRNGIVKDVIIYK